MEPPKLIYPTQYLLLILIGLFSIITMELYAEEAATKNQPIAVVELFTSES